MTAAPAAIPDRVQASSIISLRRDDEPFSEHSRVVSVVSAASGRNMRLREAAATPRPRRAVPDGDDGGENAPTPLLLGGKNIATRETHRRIGWKNVRFMSFSNYDGRS
mmetsp:Transcript_32322/g.64021  ORF Transcript_32322/g.64021 Transcript_32322/m.64021 type:complete len:108 (-) Transcript_32322:61-384(-)